MLQSSAFTLTAPSPAMAGQISRHMVKSGGLGEAMMSLALVLVGVGILAVSARIQVPFYPVPVTMQTLAVMVIAMAYGSKLGTATLFSYLFAGFIGAPVFAGGAGFAYMVGPTGGYLAGFLLAGVVLGALADRGWTRNWQTTAAAMLAGTSIIYMLGLAWLSQLIGLDKAITFGLVPFVYGDILKLVIAAASVPFMWKLVSKLTAK
ncbi:MAG: biotin transporter BioY [Candidatus Puniceispirillaceae bacterium]